MKTRFLLHFSFTVLLAVLAFGIQAQTNIANVGEVRNGVGSLTNLKEATRVLKGGLSNTAIVSNIRIEIEPESKKYYLIGDIENDAISGKGVELNQDGLLLRASAGPGIEITCTGKNCPTCRLIVSHWKFKCICDIQNPTEETKCDQTVKFVIGF